MFGLRLRQARERINLSQEKLGALIDASRQQVHAWEKSETPPNGQTVILLARALGVSSDFLLGLSEEVDGIAADLSTKERRVLNSLRRDDVVGAIKAIVGE